MSQTQAPTSLNLPLMNALYSGADDLGNVGSRIKQ